MESFGLCDKRLKLKEHGNTTDQQSIIQEYEPFIMRHLMQIQWFTT